MRDKKSDDDIRRTRDQQDTGNHPEPGSPDKRGPDRFGGTRTGAENVEEGEQRPDPAKR